MRLRPGEDSESLRDFTNTLDGRVTIQPAFNSDFRVEKCGLGKNGASTFSLACTVSKRSATFLPALLYFHHFTGHERFRAAVIELDFQRAAGFYARGGGERFASRGDHADAFAVGEA